ncbi:ADYC domain-containing protein [Nannocystis pusilla]|uniref:ADYC domain-containing protein n=1 Tax=Nannocystis pusilla TaxID=889268 RepID=UPI003B7B7DE5
MTCSPARTRCTSPVRTAPPEGPLAERGFGYRPFELGLARFEAILRVILADYCGEGTSWTEVGTLIDLVDKWNVGLGGGTVTDAVWGLDGAVCIGAQPRIFPYSDIKCDTKAKPPMCGTAAQTQTTYNNSGVVWSRTP